MSLVPAKNSNNMHLPLLKIFVQQSFVQKLSSTVVDRAREFSAAQATKAVSSFTCKECEFVLAAGDGEGLNLEC